jgi:hypothetical protein
MDIIHRLTYKIDQYGTGIEWGSGEDVGANLWRDLDNLRNNNNRNNLISNWKYKNEFECIEEWHLNGRKAFDKMSWENSFAVAMLFTIYH